MTSALDKAVKAKAEVYSALIGVASTVISTAATIGEKAIRESRGKQKGAIDVINGTEYTLITKHTTFRRGAIFHGIEGEFNRAPKPIDPRQIGVFSYQQLLGATTDVVGCVVYGCEIFDLLIGWHVFDRAGIHRYLMSALFPPGGTDSFFTERGNGKNLWDMNLDQTLNKFIWSGKWSENPNDYTSKGVAQGMALKVKGKFNRGVPTRDKDGELEADPKTGAAILKTTEVDGDGSSLEFSTSSVGGGTTMSVAVFDQPSLYQGQPDNPNRVRLTDLSKY